MVEVVGESAEVREVMFVFELVRDGRATHHLPGHHLPPLFAEVGVQAGFAAGDRENAEAQLRAVAAFFRPLQACASVGNGVGAGFYGLFAVFADFVEGEQAVVARGGGIGQSIAGGVPAMAGVAAVSPHR